MDWEIDAAEKGGYEHFMFKEIMEQPKALRDTIFPRLRGDRVVLDELTITREELERMAAFFSLLGEMLDAFALDAPGEGPVIDP